MVPIPPFLVIATWDNLGDKLWQVKFQGIELKVLGIPVTNKPLVATGIWRMTYIDDDLRILYAQVSIMIGKTYSLSIFI